MADILGTDSPFESSLLTAIWERLTPDQRWQMRMLHRPELTELEEAA